MDYIVDERITRYKSGDFIRKFYWNPAAINNDSDVKTGYIVQHIKRQTDDNKGLFSGCDLNHEYWEAWEVKENKVQLKDNGFHDRWSTPIEFFNVPSIEYSIRENAKERIGSSGRTDMEGYVYWAPLDSELYKIVKDTFQKGLVVYAAELLSAWTVPDDNRFVPVFSHSFSHSWDIDANASVEELVDPIEEYH